MALANACIWFGITHRLHGDLLDSKISLGWSQIPAKSNEGDICLFYFLYFIARKSQYLKWSHLDRSLDSAAHYEVQLTTTNSTTPPLRLRCKYLYEGASFERGDLLKVQPGHSIGPRKLWHAGALNTLFTLLAIFIL